MVILLLFSFKMFKININEATFEDSRKVHGIGPVTANAIIEMRQTRGVLYMENIQGLREDKTPLLQENFSFGPADEDLNEEGDHYRSPPSVQQALDQAIKEDVEN